MKKISFILIVSILIALLAGCEGQPAAPTPSVGEFGTPDLITPSETPSLQEDRQEQTEDGKPILYIGAFSDGSYDIAQAYSRLENAVRIFNVRNTVFEAQIIDYGDASAPEALYRLNAEIVSGKMPDMLLTLGMPTDRYASLGLLYDMGDWLDSSEYFTGPLESMRTEGKLYEVSPGITVTGFYGLSSNLGSAGELSLDELYAVWERFHTDDKKAFIEGFSNELICLLLISSVESQFVDESTSTCNFDGPEFIKLLEFCKKLPDETEALNLDADNPDLQGSPMYQFLSLPDIFYAISVKKGESLLAMMSSSRVWGIPFAPHALMTLILDGKDVTFIGIPGADSASVYMEFPVAVSANSPNLDGAKDFIDRLWTLEFMYRGSSMGDKVDLVMLPLKCEVLDDFVQNEIKRNEEDRLFYLGDGFKTYTLAEFEEFLEFINEARLPVRTPIASYIPPYSRSNLTAAAENQAPPFSSFINPIIAEEVQAFFAGARDAVQAAEHIQSRYSIYL
ncbi:MAG: hypothetical protein GX111_00770, partial [Clostridiales bacterium]|nr:hypothetical protein [Clostridiales bacterium]